MRNKKGFTLTEVLIATTLVLLVAAADASVRGMTQGYFSQVTGRAITQNEAAIAIASITRELSIAGYVNITGGGTGMTIYQDTPPAAGVYPYPAVIADPNADPKDMVVEYAPEYGTPPIKNLKFARHTFGAPEPYNWEYVGGNKLYAVTFEAYPDNTQTNSNMVKITVRAQAKPDEDTTDELTLVSTAMLKGRSATAQ